MRSAGSHPFRPSAVLAAAAMALVLVLATCSLGPAVSQAATPGPFGIESFADTLSNQVGAPMTQAGAHPYQLDTDFHFDFSYEDEETEEGPLPNGDVKNLTVNLPRGVVVDPTATPRCTEAELESDLYQATTTHRDGCPDASAVGIVNTILKVENSRGESHTPIYNMVPPAGVPAEFAFDAAGQGIYVHLFGHLRTGGDYGLSASSNDILSKLSVLGIETTLWGDPSAASHDEERGNCADPPESFTARPCAVPRSSKPFLTNPTACPGTPLESIFTAESWQEPGVIRTATGTSPTIVGCSRPDFSPKITVRPDVTAAATPTGLGVEVQLPQNESYEGLAEADLKKAVVTLPEGMVVNPSAADGLQGCSSAEIELSGPNAPTCPDASKLGNVEIDTQLLEHPVPGAVYLASPGDNPFHSLLALYIVADDPATGVVIKLAGHVEPNPVTGQLTATFDENPQLPFEDLKLNFFGGPRAPLITPDTCGTKTTTSDLTPWTTPEGADARPSAPFAITSGPGDAACVSSQAQEPNSPAFEAGTTTPIAGSYSPFVLKLKREDGSQQIGSIDATLPPGLLGKLAGIPYCPEAAIAAAATVGGVAEKAGPSCPLASEVGTVDVGAGAGSTPFHVQGHAYLAGPYKGAPLSLAIITPAVAGPFDLGDVVVRAALYVDETTAQIHAVSDPLPSILQGIPLDIRSIALDMNRPQFTLNPTSCDPMRVLGASTSTLGQTSALQSRFQVGACEALAFKPSLKLSLSGQTKRSGHPALKAVVTYPKEGAYANIARAQVSLPHSEFLDQGNLDLVCRQAELRSHSCPQNSIYGKVKAWTPLLEKPLEGNVYLGVGFGYKLPALVAELNGQIRILLKGKVDTDRQKGIRNTFEAVPDAPVSRFVLEMKGGKKYGLLENSEDLCSKKQKAKARFTAQNGKVETLNPTIANSCGGGKKKRGAGQKK